MPHHFRIFANDTAKKLEKYLAGRHILVIDPSANYRSSIRQFLLNLSIKKVTCVPSVKDAKRYMITHNIGLLIVEWLSGQENGLQFARNLQKKKDSPWTPYLLLSGENMRQDVILASEVGVDAYLLKPFSYEDFVAKMNELISEALDPNPTTVTLRNADVAFTSGELKQAKGLYEEVIEAAPNSARALKGLAEIYLAQRKYSKAEHLCNQALEQNPEFLAAHRTLLNLFEIQKKDEQILREALLLNQYSPDNPRYTLILATQYLRQQDLDQSEKFFIRTMRLSPSLVAPYRGIGSIALERRNHERAEHFLKKALDIDKNDASTLNSLGLAYINLGKYEEGLHKYRLALNIQGRDHRILFNIAQAYEKQGNPEKAIEYYRLSLHAQPGFEKAERCLKSMVSRHKSKDKVSF